MKNSGWPEVRLPTPGAVPMVFALLVKSSRPPALRVSVLPRLDVDRAQDDVIELEGVDREIRGDRTAADGRAEADVIVRAGGAEGGSGGAGVRVTGEA